MSPTPTTLHHDVPVATLHCQVSAAVGSFCFCFCCWCCCCGRSPAPQRVYRPTYRPTPPPPPPPSFACGATAPCCDYEQGAKSDDKVPGLPVDKIFFRLSSRSIFESQLLAVKIAERLYHYRHPPPPPANTAATPPHLFNHGQGIRRGRQERRQGQGRRAEEAGHALRARCPKTRFASPS